MNGRASEASIDQSFRLQSPDYSNNVLQKLNKFRCSGMYTDAILCVGQEEFPVHRNVLAVSSPYFNAMFSSDLRESHESKISFTDISAGTFRRIIDYSYSGCLEITQDNAQELLAAGNLLEYPAIVEACCRFLQHQLHTTNSLGIENIAQLHCCEELQESANKFTRDNFSAVVESDEFTDISKDRLMGFISDDSIDVPNEEIVHQAVMKWIYFDSKNRRQYLYEILNLVRLPNIESNYLKEMTNQSLITDNEKCVEMINEALQQQVCGYDHSKRRRSKQMIQIQPRPSTIAREVVVAVGGIYTQITQTVETYDVNKNKWSYLCDLPQAVSWFSVSTVENCLVLTGGMLDGYIVAHVWKYDASKRTWSRAASMLEPRARHASVELGGCVYVMGGISYNGHVTEVDTIECYDVVSDSWTAVGKCPLPRKQSRVIAFSDSFAEVGGLQSDAKVNTVDCYICNGQKHSVKSSGEQYLLPEPIQFSQILVLNGIYYIIWEDTKRVLTLNPKRRTFRSLPDMKHSHIHSGAVILNSKLYITGGLIDSKPSKTVECYDPVTNKWTTEAAMSLSRAGHGCVTLFI